MKPEDLILGLAPAVVALVSDLIVAIKNGDQASAAMIAEEAARRQAFESIQRRKVPRKIPKGGD